MDFTRLKCIKNVNDWDGQWAYKDYPKNSYFQLAFYKNQETKDQGVETNAKNHSEKGSFIILSQHKKTEKDRHLTHIVELVNEGYEDEPQWNTSESWGIFRWVKVHWIADFNNVSSIPVDKEIMKVNWGFEGTMFKSLEGPKLMGEWKSIEKLRKHLDSVFRPLI